MPIFKVTPTKCFDKESGQSSERVFLGQALSVMNNASAAWYKIANVEEVASPALLIYPDRVEENVRRMIAIAGGIERLRPHLKTHKLPELIHLQIASGIKKFKCATIAEAEMAAS